MELFAQFLAISGDTLQAGRSFKVSSPPDAPLPSQVEDFIPRALCPASEWVTQSSVEIERCAQWTRRTPLFVGTEEDEVDFSIHNKYSVNFSTHQGGFPPSPLAVSWPASQLGGRLSYLFGIVFYCYCNSPIEEEEEEEIKIRS